MNWRAPAAVAVLAVLGWVGYEVARAGNDVPPPAQNPQSTLTHGRIDGKRVDGRAWSLDYDRVQMQPDGTSAHIDHVRDGRIHREGKPDITISADDVLLNTVTNDLVIGGSLTVREPTGGTHLRTIRTNGARFAGAMRVLTLDHPATISEDGTTIRVANATVNFRTGAATLGRIEGFRAGN